MSSIVYEFGGGLYINLTNKCPCDCVFCIRGQSDGVGSAASLWLESEPTAGQVISALEEHKLDNYAEIVFCGFGEPFCALENLLEVCRYLRGRPGCPSVRINTNGLGDLINGRPVAPMLEGLVDVVSISLNASDAQKYYELCRPSFGVGSFDAMLGFAVDCKRYLPRVVLSIVDTIPEDDIARCREIADELGIPLRVRHFGM